ncbi:MAG: BON domain-containing protein [Candidatus Eisenbacteria bacterium]|nr:BON domain-containing protein [Candidatus Eisenbacteria bacterium]
MKTGARGLRGRPGAAWLVLGVLLTCSPAASEAADTPWAPPDAPWRKGGPLLEEFSAQRGRILEALLTDSRFADSRVTVTMERRRDGTDAWIFVLGGTVESLAARRAANEALHQLPDLVGFEDRLKVAPMVPREDTDLRDWLELLLANRSELVADSIQVEVRGAKVRLYGTVASNCARDVAEDLVAGTPGVVELEDQLTIVPRVTREDSLVARDAELLLEGVPSRARLRASCSNGVVTLTGCATGLRGRYLAGRAVRCLPGAVRIVNDIDPSCATVNGQAVPAPERR